ncbi:hypothetical protein ACEN9D_10730 [Pseudomonas sp. CT11-2]|uniref:hypothetical protein n=1 Tax=unclassified Pseudomonas TaxID=196821 RepID=UPI0021602615|nr:hypothetical protein [Pseudomonas sp. B21-019]UVM30646.1 hypothetical protein LOY36_15735 [Pseudomonas sp. B21-019]
MPSTIVIGTGISAAAYLISIQQYLKSINKTLGDIHLLGGPDLWQKMSPHHAMGQPQQLLTGNLLGTGREDRGFSSQPVPGADFMKAGLFSTVIKYYLNQHCHVQIPFSYVTNISKTGAAYSLKLDGRVGGRITCDQVIIAMGPGTPRALMEEDGKPSEVNVEAFKGSIVGGNEFMDPDWTMPDDSNIADATVAVYGGSATASWVVELAAMRKMQVLLWFTRPGSGENPWDAEARFSEAFPAGNRNSAIEKDFEKVRDVLKLTKVVRDLETGKLKLTLKNKDGQSVVQLVDLFVYALGADHLTKGIKTILDPGIHSSLVAFYDKNFAISSKPSLLAIGTENRSLIIVGSAMSSEAGFGKDTLWLQGDPQRLIENNTRSIKLASYKDISNTLPAAARPTEGIAMVMASIEALNEYMPVTVSSQRRLVMHSTPDFTTSAGVLPKGSPNPDAGHDRLHDIDFEWDINFNTSNRTQLAAYIAQSTDLSPFSANFAVALIVHLRTRPGNVLGLSDPQVHFVISTAERFTQALIKLNPHINYGATRLVYDKLWGPDKYLEICIEYITTPEEWKQYWKVNGIEC